MVENFFAQHGRCDARDHLDRATPVLGAQDLNLDQIAGSDLEQPQAASLAVSALKSVPKNAFRKRYSPALYGT